MTEEVTVAAAEKYGTPRRIDPLDALESELARTQGHVDWLADQIARNPDPAWLTVYQSERSHLARLSQQMISANVAERRTVVAEQTVARLEIALRATLHDLGQDPDAARVRAALTRNLQSASADLRHGSDLRHGTSNRRVTIDAPSDNVYPLPVDF